MQLLVKIELCWVFHLWEWMNNKEDLVHFTEVSFGRIKDGRYISDFFFSSFLMWKIQLLIWIFHIKKCEKNEDEVWIARPSCLVRERRSLQPWWGIHIHNFLLDRKTCKVLCKSVSRYLVGLRFLWTVTFTAAAVCYYLGEQEKKTQRRKAGPLGLDIVEV